MRSPLRVFVRLAFQPVDHMFELARLAEELGFDGVTISDHVFFPATPPSTYPRTPDGGIPFPLETPWPDPAVMMGALAAATTRLRFLTCIYILPLRHPILVARAVGTASVISRGRVSLGIGIGWQRVEFDALGIPFAERGARTTEAIDILRALWGPGPVTYDGPFHSFGPLLLEPVPDPPPPILCGGLSEAALRRAAQLGDGYVAPGGSIERMLELATAARQGVEDAGRDPGAFTVYMGATGAGLKSLLRIAQHADIVGALPWPWPGVVSLDEKKQAMETWARDVLGPLRDELGTAE